MFWVFRYALHMLPVKGSSVVIICLAAFWIKNIFLLFWRPVPSTFALAH